MKKQPKKKFDKAKLKAWLKSKGHKADAVKNSTPAEIRAELFDLHKINK